VPYVTPPQLLPRAWPEAQGFAHDRTLVLNTHSAFWRQLADIARQETIMNWLYAADSQYSDGILHSMVYSLAQQVAYQHPALYLRQVQLRQDPAFELYAYPTLVIYIKEKGQNSTFANMDPITLGLAIREAGTPACMPTAVVLSGSARIDYKFPMAQPWLAWCTSNGFAGLSTQKACDTLRSTDTLPSQDAQLNTLIREATTRTHIFTAGEIIFTDQNPFTQITQAEGQ
jgi:hypothetical protein